MEYKLKKSDLYRVCYLVAGILMFLFLFGIFNLSSYADNGSRVFIIRDSVNTGSSTHIFIGDPRFTVTASSQSGNYISFSSSLYVTTTEGTYLVDCGSSTLNTSSSPITNFGFGLRANYSLDLPGSFINCYLEYTVHDNFSGSINDITSSYDTVYISSSYIYVSSFNSFVTVTSSSSALSDSPLSDVFSDYSSYSPLTLMNNVSFRSDYSNVIVSAGSPCLFSFKGLNTTSLNFSPRYLTFNIPKGHSKILIVFIVDNKSSVVSNDLNFNVYYNGSQTNYGSSDFSIIRSYTDGTNYRWVCSKVFEFDSDLDMNLVYMVLQGNSPSTISSLNFMGYIYKATVADYMQYVQSQWDNINPSVTDLNQNTSQSVSTVGSASTYESAQFSSFDNLVTQTGVDSFSLSTVSVPLLWVGGLITTCYNNLPSSIQYLLMFVGVMGLIVIILNSGSRVIRRFGGDS